MTIRISKIAELLKGYDTICDIGCDHCLYLKEAFDNNYIKKAYAIDNKQKPLDNCKKTLNKYISNTEFILNNGINNIDLNYDLGIISGMGGLNIIEILKNSKSYNYLLVAHSNLFKLREYLSLNNFEIIYEDIVYENLKYYIFIKTKKGLINYSYEEKLIGPYIIKNSSKYFNYLKYLLKKEENIYNKSNNLINLKNINIIKNILEGQNEKNI